MMSGSPGDAPSALTYAREVIHRLPICQ